MLFNKILMKCTIKLWQLWIALLMLSFIGYILLLFDPLHTDTIKKTSLLLLGLTTVLWTYLSVRVWRYVIRLRHFFRRLLANDYSSGVKDISWIKDEISELTSLINKSADQIRIYDELRADRTGLSFRAMDFLFRNNIQAIILTEMEKKCFRLNQKALELFGLRQDVYSFDAIEMQDANEHFFKTFFVAALKDAVSTEFTSMLQFPQKNDSQKVNFRFEPLKNNGEKVRIVFLFVKKDS
jgi:PAS domain-containing protein